MKLEEFDRGVICGILVTTICVLIIGFFVWLPTINTEELKIEYKNYNKFEGNIVEDIMNGKFPTNKFKCVEREYRGSKQRIHMYNP